jgi:hypothetical protein
VHLYPNRHSVYYFGGWGGLASNILLAGWGGLASNILLAGWGGLASNILGYGCLTGLELPISVCLNPHFPYARLLHLIPNLHSTYDIGF